jgi:alkylated DNA repair dioxygenase AlkB
MDLFPTPPTQNLLPCDGTVLYLGPILTPPQADHYFSRLLQHIAWTHDQVIMFGKRLTTARKVAWYGAAPFAYTYSGITKSALPWITELIELKNLVEQHSQASFNSCLLNLYHSGQEGMTWHSDDEKMLAHHAPIASLSLGAQRRFSFKHKHQPHRLSLELEHGSLLVMKDETQSHWLHALPKATRIPSPRINLTFRAITIDSCEK